MSAVQEVSGQVATSRRREELCGQLSREIERLGELRKSLDSESILADPEHEALVEIIHNEIDDVSANLQEICPESLEVLLEQEMSKDAEMSREIQDGFGGVDEVVVEIRLGSGGTDSCLLAEKLVRMYENLCKGKMPWICSKIDETPANLGIRKAILRLEGRGVSSCMRWESGLHRAITNSKGKIQTSAATIALLPSRKVFGIELKKTDLKIETFKSSGPGGQAVNTTDSAVRVTHIPTGIVAASQLQRCQNANRKNALELLQLKIYEQQKRNALEQRARESKVQHGSGEWSERIRTYNFHTGVIIDHRLGSSNCNTCIEWMETGDLLPEIWESLQNSKLQQLIKSCSYQ